MALQEQVDAIVDARADEVTAVPVSQETHIHIHTTDTNVPHVAALAIYNLDRGLSKAQLEGMDTTPPPEVPLIPDLTEPLNELRTSVAALQGEVAVAAKTAAEKQTQELLVAKVQNLELMAKARELEAREAPDVRVLMAEMAGKLEPLNVKLEELAEEVRRLQMEAQKSTAPDAAGLAKVSYLQNKPCPSLLLPCRNAHT